MFVGGLRALLLQSLHPLAMAGVADHSDYRTDPWHRLQRTADFLAATTYGPAAEAERAWNEQQSAGIDAWLQRVGERESTWVGVIGGDLQSLSSYPLTHQEIQRLTFLRGLDWPVSRRHQGRPWLKIPFPNDPSAGSLVIELPQRFMPGRYRVFWRVITNGVIPGLFTLLLCVGLYRLLVVPLNSLREQANAWRADQLTVRLSSRTTNRSDELGELGRAFDHMAERLQSTVALQQQLLRDLSHELRTPLSRLRVASDSEQDLGQLRERIGREVDGMQRLVEDALQLAWLDTEPAQVGRKYWVRHGNRWCQARIAAIEHRLDIHTLQPGEAQQLAVNEIGRVVIETQQPLPVEPYADNRMSGALIVVDPATHRTSGALLVKEAL